ncbi:hypothetical protein SCORR_v1c06130 [Spiroplasma corruscae]|uniref:Uncharacterized protein n=1 Tax=Spiroplasma corruscae TaxID=216934 RepID=A0A222EPE1_9MOLU|nr:hypothetical protein [Spiroplasma corruscae]ASP28385.1 hypothetical protein SCORR_v1c06130 [Spiroplasma corruscae]
MSKVFLFKFYLLRILKSKIFIILTSIILTINIIIMSIVFIISKEADSITTSSIVLIVLNLLFLTFFNTANITDFFIQDNISNIESLMIRKGKRPSNIFISRILSNKLCSITYCFVIFILFITLSNITTFKVQEPITNKYSFGIFALIAYDLLITSITLILSVCTKKMKSTLPLPWIMATLFSLYPTIGPMILYIINIGDLSLSSVTMGDNLGLYDTYLERKNNNRILNKLYADYNDTTRIIAYNDVFNNENLFNIKQINGGYNQHNNNDINQIKNYLINISSSSWQTLDFYYQNKQNKLTTFIKEYIESLKVDDKLTVIFGEDFSSDLLKVQESDPFLKDLIAISPEPVDTTSNTNQYLNNVYFINNNSFEVYKGNNGIKNTLLNIDFSKLIESSVSEVNSIDQILRNQFYYYYQLYFYTNINSLIINTQKKFILENNIELIKKHFIVPYNFSNLIYFLINLQQEPKTVTSDKFFSYLKYKTRNTLYYNLNPFMHFFIMANNIGIEDKYYEAFIYKSFAFQIPLYWNNIIKSNDLETILDPKIPNEYKEPEPYFHIYTPYLIWILSSISLIVIAYSAYIKLIYKKSSDN